MQSLLFWLGWLAGYSSWAPPVSSLRLSGCRHATTPCVYVGAGCLCLCSKQLTYRAIATAPSFVSCTQCWCWAWQNDFVKLTRTHGLCCGLHARTDRPSPSFHLLLFECNGTQGPPPRAITPSHWCALAGRWHPDPGYSVPINIASNESMQRQLLLDHYIARAYKMAMVLTLSSFQHWLNQILLKIINNNTFSSLIMATYLSCCDCTGEPGFNYFLLIIINR